jgi:hypothetical protein
MADTTYTTRGGVRGCCGHAHQSIETAAACLRDDHSDCASQGGYSDREIARTDGEKMTEEEHIEIYYMFE